MPQPTGPHALHPAADRRASTAFGDLAAVASIGPSATRPAARRSGWELVMQRLVRILGPITVIIAAGVPGCRRRDVDNLCKAVLDLLTATR
jgi:hypothetical protein